MNNAIDFFILMGVAAGALLFVFFLLETACSLWERFKDN